MTTLARNRSAVPFTVAVTVVMSLVSMNELGGSVVSGVAVPQKTQSFDRSERQSPRPGICQRNAEKLVGQKALRINRSDHAPKKVRNVLPRYPDLPPDTSTSGEWFGEILINQAGRIAHVWPLLEPRLAPPFTAFNMAISDAIRQWEFEPTIIEGKAVPVCLSVAINIDWP
jgi:hypothetical protein